MVKVRINISGTIFEVDSNLFEKPPPDRKLVGKLPVLVREAVSDGSNTLEFQRPAASFAVILEFYQTGELHMPSKACPASFKKELDFWGLGISTLEECCRTKYRSFAEEQSLLGDFKKELTGDSEPAVSAEKLTTRARIWRVVDNRSTSKLAKGYFSLTIVAVLASIAGITLGTEQFFKREATFCEMMEYLGFSNLQRYERLKERIGNKVCQDPAKFRSEEIPEMPRGITTEEDESNFYINTSPTKEKIKNGAVPLSLTIPKLFLKSDILTSVDYVTLGFFTIDFFLRLVTCPSLLKFIMSPLNVIDFLALMGSFLHITISEIWRVHKYETNWVDVLEFIQVFRALRMLRLVKHIKTSRVLTFSIRRSIWDLSVMTIFVLIFNCIFGSLIYFAEDKSAIKSIPEGFWWSVVTLTTVGYGDIIPRTSIGRLVGSLCALTGIWLLSLTLPIFVNTFITLYQYPGDSCQHMDEEDGLVQDEALKYEGDQSKAVAVKQASEAA